MARIGPLYIEDDGGLTIEQSGELERLTAATLVDEVGVETLRGPQGEPGPPGDPGEPGEAGDAGRDGRTIHPADGRPDDGVGADGDFALDDATSTLYGPKAAGSWPAGVSLIGPAGRDAVIDDESVEARHLAGALKPSGSAVAGDEALRRLGSTAGEAAPGATALHVVDAGSDGDAPRPAGAAWVLWLIDDDEVVLREQQAGDLVAVGAS